MKQRNQPPKFEEFLSLADLLEIDPQTLSSNFYTDGWRAAMAIHNTALRTRRNNDSKFKVDRLTGAYRDTQRQMACSARYLSNDVIDEEEPRVLAELGSSMQEAECSPYIPKVSIAQNEHREKLPAVTTDIYPACVARQVPKSEWKGPTAVKALDAEWERLRTIPWPDRKGKGTWDETRVREASQVRAGANARNKTVHFSRIAELLYEKGSELNNDDPYR